MEGVSAEESVKSFNILINQCIISSEPSKYIYSQINVYLYIFLDRLGKGWIQILLLYVSL